MKRIGILGDIGSGKSYVSKCFGYPVFNADLEVGKIYKKDKNTFKKLKKKLPTHFESFPIKKTEIINAILEDKNNLRKIVKVVHFEVRKKLNIFSKKNRNKKIVILDIPLLLENRINKKGDILIFVDSKKFEIRKRLKKRKNFNFQLLRNFKKIQLPLDLKKKKSQFIIKNNFKKNSVKIEVRKILKNIL
tara:strand:+ start:3403 stop:3972 length:570 start_codon:yes stop_codon:yes gene_type:complete